MVGNVSKSAPESVHVTRDVTAGRTHQGGHMEYRTKDSGRREEFDSGMVRDAREGKGRYDLLSPFVLERDAELMERGAAKYDAWNWSKGAPFSRFIDSAIRHLLQFAAGDDTEDHLAAVRFNVGAIMHFQATGRTDLDDRQKWGQP